MVLQPAGQDVICDELLVYVVVYWKEDEAGSLDRLHGRETVEKKWRGRDRKRIKSRNKKDELILCWHEISTRAFSIRNLGSRDDALPWISIVKHWPGRFSSAQYVAPRTVYIKGRRIQMERHQICLRRDPTFITQTSPRGKNRRFASHPAQRSAITVHRRGTFYPYNLHNLPFSDDWSHTTSGCSCLDE